MVSAYVSKTKKNWPKNVKKVESKIGPSMMRDIIGPIIDSNNGIFVFWKISFSLQKEEDFLEKNKQTNLGRFQLSGLRNANAKRRVFWTQAT